MRIAFSLLNLTSRVLAVFALLAVSSFAAKPTPEDDLKIVGNWKVMPPHMERVYQIDATHNLKMIGTGAREKEGQLMPRDDGSYTINLERGAIERFTYDRALDQLMIEYFDNKRTMDVGMVRWKGPGVRIPAKK